LFPNYLYIKSFLDLLMYWYILHYIQFHKLMNQNRALSVVLASCVVLSICSCSTNKMDERIPVTTRSEEAYDLFVKGVDAHSNYEVEQAMEFWRKALQVDPQFFRAAYTLAIYSLHFGDMEAFEVHAEEALSMDLKVSEGEELLKEALETLYNDPEADVAPIGEKLIHLYPNDYASFYQLAMYCSYKDDYEGVIDAMKRSLNVLEDKTPAYNIIGYANMQLERFEEAARAFDTCLMLSPDLPNPYDSKGDYFYEINDLESALSCYLKALEIDSSFSLAKAKAKYVQRELDSLKRIISD
jgi:tetratricopeptide (TPR) repeat protein